MNKYHKEKILNLIQSALSFDKTDAEEIFEDVLRTLAQFMLLNKPSEENHIKVAKVVYQSFFGCKEDYLDEVIPTIQGLISQMEMETEAGRNFLAEEL